MKRPFSLIAEAGSTDTLACVEKLAEEVRAGRVIGLAYVKIERGRNYRFNVCGEAHRSPAFARGALAALDDKLGRMQRGEEA